MTPRMQRIGILVIAVVMIVGTLGSFAVFILADKNQKTQQDILTEQYQQQMEQQQKEAKELSDKYYDTFKEYESRPAEFDANTVGDEVTTVDLKEGSGEVITDDTAYRAYYMGWNPAGKMFDSSFSANKDSLQSPLTHVGQGTWEFPGGQTGGVIEGWNQGVIGMKIGGVREITIPSEFAYKDQDRGADIPPNTPLKFIIMTIPVEE